MAQSFRVLDFFKTVQELTLCGPALAWSGHAPYPLRKFAVEDEAHGFYSIPGKTANIMGEFLKVQLDRQLANRHSSDDKKTGNIYVVDANFTERPNKIFKDRVVKKLEKTVLEKLELTLGL